jgi:iron complex outermembrane recepter protein
MKRLLLCTCAYLIALHFYGQTTQVTFTIINKKTQPVVNVSLKIKPANADSTIVIQTNNQGVVEVPLTIGVNYNIQIQAAGYDNYNAGILVAAQKNNFTYTLLKPNTNEVVVKSKASIIKQVDDKSIIATESLAASSTNGFEVIEKAPGLFVDSDGNIYLTGTTPATIYINGREQKMSTADIATMLKSLPPNAIERLEVLRTPSSKYDASSAGGIVNVVLKKGVKIGLTGSATIGANAGRYSNQFAGVNINNSTDNTTKFINVQVSNRNTYEQFITKRNFNSDSLLTQNATSLLPAQNFYTGLGYSKQVSKKFEYSYDGRFNLNNYQNNTTNNSDITKAGITLPIVNTNASIKNKSNQFTTGHGLFTKYKIDSLGSEFTTDFSVGYTNTNTDQNYVNNLILPISTNNSGNGDINAKRTNIALQVDYTKKLKNKFTLETGIKANVLWFKNQTNFLRTESSTTIKDNFRTNTFKYTENINAVYITASKTFGKDAVIKLGTRLENTNMNGNQLVPADTAFNINRTDLFPYVYISKNIISLFGMPLRAYAIAKRSITRPNYDFLNPFQRYVDQFLNEAGNPALRPQFTNNYEFNISYQDFPIIAIGVRETKDIFTSVIYQQPNNRSTALRTYDNLGKNKETYFRMVAGMPPGGKYFFVLGAEYNHNNYNGFYEGLPLRFKRGSWRFFTFHQVKFDKRSTLFMNGYLINKGQQQFYELGAFGQLNASVNRQFLNKKLVVTVSMQDIFFTNNNTFAIKQGTVNATGSREIDSRRFGINFRYNFGIRKKEKENNNMFNTESQQSN